MIRKVKLVCINKNECRCFAVFPKVQEVFSIVREILFRLGFDKEDKWIVGIGRDWDEETELPIRDKERDIKQYSEIISNYKNKDYSVDVIFMDNSVGLIVNSKEDRQNEFSDALNGLILEEDELLK